MEIREATADDLDAMAGVYRRASLSNDGDRPLLLAEPAYLELSDAAIRPGRSLVAVVDGRVIGFVSVDPVTDGVELEALFVDPDRMRRGVGSALVGEVVARVRRRGFSTISVSANTHAVGFYAHLGFVEVGTVELEFGPAPRMALPVSGPVAGRPGGPT